MTYLAYETTNVKVRALGKTFNETQMCAFWHLRVKEDLVQFQHEKDDPAAEDDLRDFAKKMEMSRSIGCSGDVSDTSDDDSMDIDSPGCKYFCLHQLTCYCAIISNSICMFVCLLAVHSGDKRMRAKALADARRKRRNTTQSRPRGKPRRKPAIWWLRKRRIRLRRKLRRRPRRMRKKTRDV